MGTFFQRIEGLNDIPNFHFKYAEGVLKLFIHKLLELNEIDVGDYSEANNKTGAIITVTVDEFESVIISLKYSEGIFTLEIFDNSENNQTSTFLYNLSDNPKLEESIPEGLRDFMENVAMEGEGAVFIPGTLK